MAVDSIQLSTLTSKYNCKGNYSERPQDIAIGMALTNANKQQIAVDNFMDKVSPNFSQNIELSDENSQSGSKQSGTGFWIALGGAILSTGAFVLSRGKVKAKNSTFGKIFESTKLAFKSFVQKASVKIKTFFEDFLSFLFSDKNQDKVDDLVEHTIDVINDNKKATNVVDDIVTHPRKETPDVVDDIVTHTEKETTNIVDDVVSHTGHETQNTFDDVISNTADDFSRVSDDIVSEPNFGFNSNDYDLYSYNMNNPSFDNYSVYSEDIINPFDNSFGGFDFAV
ncbi:hypothetical protein J6A64_00790 [bacterium]|nr:hypothetical protein [bacterium]